MGLFLTLEPLTFQPDYEIFGMLSFAIYLHANDGISLPKTLLKEIMHRTNLRDKYTNARNAENFMTFKNQRVM